MAKKSFQIIGNEEKDTAEDFNMHYPVERNIVQNDLKDASSPEILRRNNIVDYSINANPLKNQIQFVDSYDFEIEKRHPKVDILNGYSEYEFSVNTSKDCDDNKCDFCDAETAFPVKMVFIIMELSIKF